MDFARRKTIGRMRHRITVEKQSAPTQTYGDVEKTWDSLFTSEPADYEHAKGGLGGRGRQLQEGVDAIFLVRNRDGYTTRCRVGFDGNSYGVVFIRPLGVGDRYLELHCKLVT